MRMYILDGIRAFAGNVSSMFKALRRIVEGNLSCAVSDAVKKSDNVPVLAFLSILMFATPQSSQDVDIVHICS